MENLKNHKHKIARDKIQRCSQGIVNQNIDLPTTNDDCDIVVEKANHKIIAFCQTLAIGERH
ncbi:hypothetical protein H6G41_29255 [Tolypothrix sp. FACHB-123]|uniref:hypothetical protein n=1 Tax=Tolypothrix sp. FACHB-123 TaxID=2692868 RepID=UPI001689804E|nr:hypothetical protein [Tolypothrix sp. FACHB-123]MBD2358648.1 hypothetical protein [Tolypothrix sp. FACHB-123]